MTMGGGIVSQKTFLISHQLELQDRQTISQQIRLQAACMQDLIESFLHKQVLVVE
jgi:hypothetical protein